MLYYITLFVIILYYITLYYITLYCIIFPVAASRIVRPWDPRGSPGGRECVAELFEEDPVPGRPRLQVALLRRRGKGRTRSEGWEEGDGAGRR